ncbi:MULTISPECIES: Lrp/AsnC family transcriptional regulator [unclassified Leifsonia]|uniref:Lrp/AsnC family transcriptional regulator n=1 Tax=unclassified Leifsonia TaxID=2663824 RepID=UPI0008A80CB4|nr:MULTISPECIES: Lrp/AsnC family transcriptional regulator [unclassified Leifsonia]SEI02932.1 DNA-binding transcriptional regulator, Lrp family [Leifsonia sp. CL154]SFL71996.1 DNA-binding transcriptional regulator, Lrp family [Leifsonia sp. CL147]
MATRHLDEIDEQLLAELTNNARVSLVTLGNRVHLSRNAVRQRVERMERDGIIGGYTLTPGKNSKGGRPIRANVFVYRLDRMRGELVLSAIRAIPEVVRCDILSGDFDLLLAVEAETVERMQAVWEQIAALPEVANTVTSLTLATPVNRHTVNALTS